jgi:hypothetical protein
MREPVDVARSLTDPHTYDDTIMRIFDKRRERGHAFDEAQDGVSYFETAQGRHELSRAIAGSIADGSYRTQPVDLWFLETKGKRRAAHMPVFTDHVVGSALYRLLSHNAQCYGLPGVYSYLPGLTNGVAMRALAAFVRRHRQQVGAGGPPMYVLQSDFDRYGDDLPVGPDAPLWPILREIATMGSPNHAVPEHIWQLITNLTRPVVRDAEGGQFVRLHGVAMGTPVVPLLSNLAVLPMDKEILGVDAIFYARYNDDFLLAHPDLDALHEADRRIDAMLTGLGVKRKLPKEIRTALSGNGRPSTADPAYRGCNRIDCLGLSVSHAGAMTVGPHRLRRFIQRIASRIDGASSGLAGVPVAKRAEHLVATTNVMLDAASPFAVGGLSALLDATTDRGVLKDLDFRIARTIVQAATATSGVHGFREVPPRTLYTEMGLTSLVRLRNMR